MEIVYFVISFFLGALISGSIANYMWRATQQSIDDDMPIFDSLPVVIVEPEPEPEYRDEEEKALCLRVIGLASELPDLWHPWSSRDIYERFTFTSASDDSKLILYRDGMKISTFAVQGSEAFYNTCSEAFDILREYNDNKRDEQQLKRTQHMQKRALLILDDIEIDIAGASEETV